MILDLVKNTPPVYTEESRDFQLFLRLYNAALNSAINDANSLVHLTDSMKCKDNVLPLVKSRVGFLTRKDIQDNHLRVVLNGFSEVIKYKGTLKGITLATNLFLNALNIPSDVIVFYSSEGGLVVDRRVDDHTIIIGLSTLMQNYYILEEILRYVAPAGIGIVCNFFYTYNKYEWFRDLESAKLLFVGNQYADSIRYNTYDSSKAYAVGDVVCYNNICYTCLSACTNIEPGSSGTYWEVNNVATRIISAVDTLGVAPSDATADTTLEITQAIDDADYDVYDNI